MSRSRRPWSGDPMTVLVAALFLVLLLITLALAVPGGQVLTVLPPLLSAGLYLAAGLIAWRRRPRNRTGLLMLLAGLSLWLTALGALPDDVLATVGILASNLPLSLVAHLVLAFPSGRVQGRAGRFFLTLCYLASTLFQLPVVLVGPGRIAIWDPPGAASIVVAAAWVQTVVGVVSVLGTAAVVIYQSAHADPVERRLLGPMVWYRAVLPLVIAFGALEAQITDAAAPAGVTVLQFLGVLGLPVVFLVGLLLGSFGRAGELDELVTRIGATTPGAGELSAAVAQALGDPQAVVVYARSDGAGFLDEDGRSVPTEQARGRRIHPVAHSGRTVGGIVHHEDLVTDGSEMEVIAGIVAMGIDAQRLSAEQRALLAELQTREVDLHASRRRLLQAEDSERRRISRDLHDGAQQHIVLLGLRARQLSRHASEPDVVATAAGIADGMTGLLNELRDFIAGIMPAPLLERGLVAAVELLAQQMPVPTAVELAEAPGRLAPDAESTLYFAVSEALTNVAKHASAGSARVRVTAVVDEAGRRVGVTVEDDGVGGADPASGTGLSGLQDRVAALGGTLTVTSPVGGGTVVHVEVPCV